MSPTVDIDRYPDSNYRMHPLTVEGFEQLIQDAFMAIRASYPDSTNYIATEIDRFSQNGKKFVEQYFANPENQKNACIQLFQDPYVPFLEAFERLGLDINAHKDVVFPNWWTSYNNSSCVGHLVGRINSYTDRQLAVIVYMVKKGAGLEIMHDSATESERLPLYKLFYARAKTLTGPTEISDLHWKNEGDKMTLRCVVEAYEKTENEGIDKDAPATFAPAFTKALIDEWLLNEI
ncbi:MAG: hypothetical protein ABW189_00055 [Rickettsiales bacterium]